MRSQFKRTVAPKSDQPKAVEPAPKKMPDVPPDFGRRGFGPTGPGDMTKAEAIKAIRTGTPSPANPVLTADKIPPVPPDFGRRGFGPTGPGDMTKVNAIKGMLSGKPSPATMSPPAQGAVPQYASQLGRPQSPMVGSPGLGGFSQQPPMGAGMVGSTMGGMGMKKGGKVKSKQTTKMASGGKVSSASKRADGCAVKGKTKGRIV